MGPLTTSCGSPLCPFPTVFPLPSREHPALESVPFSPVAQSCPTLCNPMDCSRPGLPVHRQLLEPAQTHAHQLEPCYSLVVLRN